MTPDLPESDAPAATPRKRTSRGLTVFVWGVIGLISAACAAPWVSSLAWPIDLAAQATPHAAVLAAFLAVGALLARRRGAATVAALAAGLGGFAVVDGRRLTLDTPGSGLSPVRVLIYNALASNTSPPERLREVIIASDADVVALMEAPNWLIAELREDPAWRERYPAYWVSPRAEAGFKVLLTRWPQRNTDDGSDDLRRTVLSTGREAIVDRPGAPFVFALAQPSSPRSAARWASGNGVIRGLAERAPLRAAAAGLPVVIGGDLNATPTGRRSRLARDLLGLRRGKPVLIADGTFPSAWPWPARIAIDDVLVEPGTGVVAWDTVDGGGSDHAAVIIELDIPAPSAP